MNTPSRTIANTPTPTPTSTNPGTSSGGASSSYVATLLSNQDSSNHGQISLNANGSGNVQLKNATAGTAYSIQFCQFPNGTTNCFSVGSFTTDASGNARDSFTFSKSGTWVGIFEVQPTSGGAAFGSSFPNPSSPSDYQNPLQRASTVSGGLPVFLGSPGSDPLTSGFITVTGTVAHVTLSGAAANATYSVGFCANAAGSSCFADLGTVTTDANGNGTGDAQTNGFNPPGVFHVGRNGVVQFVTGVHVP